MSGRLAGKTAVITGGTSGIGEATVRLFAREGAQVVFCGRSEERGAAIAAELGPTVRFVRADVTKEADIQGTLEVAVGTFGRIDCLFNNAGAMTQGKLDSVTQNEFLEAMNLLVGSVVFGIKHCVPVMRQQGSGRIINNSSVAALRAGLGGWLYSGAKAAVTQLSRVAAVELGPHGITVNSVSPGATATPLFFSRPLDAAREVANMERLIRGLSRATPIPRAGFPCDVAAAVLFLASDEAAFVNGLDLVVDGGLTARAFRNDVSGLFAGGA